MRTFLRFALAGLACLFAVTLSAQATRTWVSGVGDDANPGSRTAPCKTFAGAISKTAAGGEIDCLDPGGFGAVTITKAITLDGGGGQVASILVSGTNGMTINAGANDVVILRNLRFQGIGTGLIGINFVAGKALIIENCTIMNFTTRGIYINSSTPMTLSVSNSSITGTPAATGLIGLMIDHASAQVTADLDNVHIWGVANTGIYTQTGKLTIHNSVVSEGGYGIVSTTPADVQLDGVVSANNSSVGLKMGGGTMRISNCTITGNGTGVQITAGTINTYGNNFINGNAAGNGPLSGPVAQQ